MLHYSPNFVNRHWETFFLSVIDLFLFLVFNLPRYNIDTLIVILETRLMFMVHRFWVCELSMWSRLISQVILSKL
jgi:hypothetical protein